MGAETASDQFVERDGRFAAVLVASPDELAAGRVAQEAVLPREPAVVSARVALDFGVHALDCGDGPLGGGEQGGPVDGLGVGRGVRGRHVAPSRGSIGEPSA